MLLSILILLSGCDVVVLDTDPQGTEDTGEVGLPDDGPEGFVGSPCDSDADCAYEGGVCYREDEGFPRGMCSVGCELYCPDADGYPVTFCVPDEELPAQAPSLDDGACHSRCDFGFFPETGCRPDYGCAVTARANEPDTLKYACLPERESQVSECHAELASRGVRFEPTVVVDAHPDGHPELTCHVEEPVMIRPPIHGVDYAYSSGEASGGILSACDMALAISDTTLDLQDHGVSQVRHMGTYNCRVISGTSTLSQHSFGNAIDIWGVDFPDGTTYSLVDDWEHDTTSPQSPGGAFLYEAAYRWFDAGYWNIILTPNYNSAHDDHFHVDLTPGGDFIHSWMGPRYIGPAPYDD